MPRNNTSIAVGAALLTACLWYLYSQSSSGPVMAAEEDAGTKMEKLAQRLAALEKVVLDDPFRPKNTVLARLDAIEERLGKLDKQGVAEAKEDSRTLDAMRDGMKETTRSIEHLERRLKAVEQDKKGGADAGLAADVRELKRDVDQIERTLDDLKNRVSKLESKR